MLRRELARTCARGLSALRSAASGSHASLDLAGASDHARAYCAPPSGVITAEDVADATAMAAAFKKDPKSSHSKYSGKDWWAECTNKATYFDNPEALAMVDEYFDSLMSVCVSEDAKREVRKHRAVMLGMVDEYRQLFKEIGKNPYMTDAWEVDWAKMAKEFPGKTAAEEIAFFQDMDKKISPLVEEQRSDFVANKGEILFQQPAWVAYKKSLEGVGADLVKLNADYEAEIAKCEEKIEKIEEELESLDYITIEECLEGNPELAAEIDAEIERQEW